MTVARVETDESPMQPSVSAEDMALREIRHHLAEVELYLPKAAGRKEKKKKYVHQLRVESRRAAAALDLFNDFIPVRQKARLDKQLKKIRHAAGQARDLDVLIDLLARDKTGQDSNALLEIARRHRKKAQADLRRARKRVQGFTGQVKKLLKNAEAEAEAKRHRLGFAPWAHLRLHPIAAKFFEEAPPADASLKKLHAFRIKAKQLRYMMEMLEPAFPAAFKKELLPRVESLQDRLGEIIDITERRKRFKKWLSKTGSKTARLHLREHIALDASRLEQARADFTAWCTPAFLQKLHADFDAVLGAQRATGSAPKTVSPAG
jgi:CHAD domain-containing protein